jgi:hypothetical protein
MRPVQRRATRPGATWLPGTAGRCGSQPRQVAGRMAAASSQARTAPRTMVGHCHHRRTERKVDRSILSLTTHRAQVNWPLSCENAVLRDHPAMTAHARLGPLTTALRHRIVHVCGTNHGSGGGKPHLSNLCILPAWTRSLISPCARIIPRIFRIMETSAATARTVQGRPASGPGRLRPGPWSLTGVSVETPGQA